MRIVREELGDTVGLALDVSQIALGEGRLVPNDAYNVLFRAAELSKVEGQEPRTIAELAILASINEIVSITE